VSRKTHEKELARARAKRQAERSARQRSRRMVAAAVVGVVAIAAVVIGLALQGDDPAEPDPVATGQATAEPTAPAGSDPAIDAPASDPELPATEDPTASEPFASEPPPMVIEEGAEYTATIETEEGTIVVGLASAEAPMTVNNFVALASAGYYDGVVFHRIQEGFVIQGGDPEGTGRGGPGYQFEDELTYAEEVVEENDGQYPRGTLAMANAGPNTNGSQFFVVDAEPGYPFPPNYTIFGMVVEGLETVDAIAAGEVTGPGGDQAVDPVAMTSVTIDGPVDQEAVDAWANAE
jgi:cyclophilin family peptidyl-prolyl cis-trans isomerase